MPHSKRHRILELRYGWAPDRDTRAGHRYTPGLVDMQATWLLGTMEDHSPSLLAHALESASWLEKILCCQRRAGERN